MGFRFQRRIKIFPGFSLNFSKSGISASAGVKGLTLNSRGMATIGIPGTGLSFRQNLDTKPSPGDVATEMIDEFIPVLLETMSDSYWSDIGGGNIPETVLNCDCPAKVRKAAVLTRNIAACESHCRKARGPASAQKAMQKIHESIQVVLDWVTAQTEG